MAYLNGPLIYLWLKYARNVVVPLILTGKYIAGHMEGDIRG